ncbi:hypothetical protein Leryth_021556 [Lithospermum erythrorhizon]|nr:hypothetical protein Leryth_021556 [Lithospermum erythrorhizon]
MKLSTRLFFVCIFSAAHVILLYDLGKHLPSTMLADTSIFIWVGVGRRWRFSGRIVAPRRGSVTLKYSAYSRRGRGWELGSRKIVLSGSPAEICGLHHGDVVFKCSDTTIVSPLQFFEVIWDMAGKVVEVNVVREGSYKNMKIEVKDIISADEFYHRWLLPRAYVTMSREL